ncbi:MAG: hypothetical protein N4A33_11825 [Bacteriovoracaceae bacterium]|jgi:hypothetical protein|nr:hypothetical protein [Bacteriovoracaceae bacterium]
MNVLSLFILALVSTSVFSNELITNYDLLEKLDKELDSKPIYKKRKIGKSRRIELADLGRAKSPYFYLGSTPVKIFEDFFNNCYLLRHLSKMILATKTHCLKRQYTVTLGDKVFRNIDRFDKFKNSSFETKKKDYTFSIEAFHHSFRDFNEDPSGEFPFSKIDIGIEDFKSINFSPRKITFKTHVILKRTKYSYLSDKVKDFSYSLAFEPYKGDIILQNADEFVLFKRYQPGIFRFDTLALSSSFLSYLENINEFLFDYNGKKRCFREDWIEDSKYDCDFLIMKNKPVMKIVKFNYVLINTKGMTIKLK